MKDTSQFFKSAVLIMFLNGLLFHTALITAGQPDDIENMPLEDIVHIMTRTHPQKDLYPKILNKAEIEPDLRKSLVDALVVRLFEVGTKEAYNSKTKRPVIYHLLVEKKVSSQTGAIACRLRVENRTDTLQFVSRPKEKDISLSMRGLDKRRYSVSFDERGFESLAKRGIPLRPKCAIEMKLAKIVLKKAKDGQARIPRGNYSFTASWKHLGFPIVKPGKFKVVKKYTPRITDVQPSDDEYPLGIILEPSSKVYYIGKPIMLSVRIQNNGPLPVKLLNHFHPYKNHFRFEKKYATSNKKIKEAMHPIALITPHAIEGWITLLPGESLSVLIDGSDEFKTSGEYRANVTYYRSRILLYPPSGKPYYTEQHSWASKEVDLFILQNPNLKKSK